MSTCTPQGAAARRCATSAASASCGDGPGGMRRFSRAAAFGTMAAADPTTGGQSMPRMVTAGRAQSMSETLPSPSRETPSRTPASCANCSGGYGAPDHSAVLSSPGDRGVPAASRSEASMATSAARASGAAPPNIPGVDLRGARRHGDHHVDHAAQADGRGGVAHRPRSRCRRRGSRRRGGGRRSRGRRPRGRPCPAPRSPRPPSFRSTPIRSPSARSAARCATMLPLQSAVPPAVPAPADLGRARRAGCARPGRRAAAGRRSGRRAAPWARRPGRRPGDPTTAMLPSAVSSSRASAKPRSANFSSTHWAARSHSSAGYWRASATERRATSSVSSSLTTGIRSATRRLSSSMDQSPATSSVLRSSANSWKSSSSSGQ